MLVHVVYFALSMNIIFYCSINCIIKIQFFPNFNEVLTITAMFMYYNIIITVSKLPLVVTVIYCNCLNCSCIHQFNFDNMYLIYVNRGLICGYYTQNHISIITFIIISSMYNSTHMDSIQNQCIIHMINVMYNDDLVIMLNQ